MTSSKAGDLFGHDGPRNVATLKEVNEIHGMFAATLSKLMGGTIYLYKSHPLEVGNSVAEPSYFTKSTIGKGIHGPAQVKGY